MSDFSDRPFVAGSLFGLRAFKIDKLGRLLGPSVPQVFRLHANYPDVPFYATRREAVAAHPLTPPAVPGPEDDDFWTRPVA